MRHSMQLQCLLKVKILPSTHSVLAQLFTEAKGFESIAPDASREPANDNVGYSSATILIADAALKATG
jgi:hypothetical protein